MDKRKKQYLINDEADLKTAMAQIEENNHRCVVIVNQNRQVVGTLTDGDIRKHLLHGNLLTAPVREVMNLNFTALAADQRERVRELFAANPHLILIPVVDAEGKLLDIVEAY